MSDFTIIGDPSQALSATSMQCNFTSLTNALAWHLFGQSPDPTAKTVAAWMSANPTEANQIEKCIMDGMMFVYSAYRWSFMRPVVSVTTVLSTNSYSLPTGFDSFLGPLTYPGGSNWLARPIPRVDEFQIRKHLEHDITPRQPQMYALVTDSFDPTLGSSRSVIFYPIPDAAYVLSAKASLRPTMIDATNQYPMGAEVLSPVLMESVLAAGERNVEVMDSSDPRAVHNRALVPLLAAAIQRDKELSSPDSLGVDHGEGDREHLWPIRRQGSIYWDGGGYEGYL